MLPMWFVPIVLVVLAAALAMERRCRSCGSWRSLREIEPTADLPANFGLWQCRNCGATASKMKVTASKGKRRVGGVEAEPQACPPFVGDAETDTRTFRIPNDARYLLAFLLGVGALGFVAKSRTEADTGEQMLLVLFGILFVFGGVSVFRSRIEVEGERIRITYSFHALEIGRGDISAVRVDSRGFCYLVVASDPRRVRFTRDIALPIERQRPPSACLTARELAQLLGVPIRVQ